MVVVNGQKITKGDFIGHALFLENIYRIRQKDIPSDEIVMEEVAEHSYPLLMQMIQNVMLDQYAAIEKIEPSESDVRIAETNTLLALGLPVDADYGKIVRSLPSQVRAAFSRLPYLDARNLCLRESVTTNDLRAVSEAELEARQAFVRKFDANADRLNAEARKKLNALREKYLASHEPFDKFAARVSQVSPEHGSKWLDVELSELAVEEDLTAWLKIAKEGDVSEPIDLQDGLAIVKLVKKHDGDAPPGEKPPTCYQMVKCTLYAYERMRVQDRQQMTKQLLIWKNEEAQAELCEQLIKTAVLEYPNGTNFFPRVSSDLQ